MKCTNCGADIPDGMLICPDCFTEVLMVPDYNPLDDVLARQVKGSVEGITEPRHESGTQRGGSLDYIRIDRTKPDRQNRTDAENVRSAEGYSRRSTDDMHPSTGGVNRVTDNTRRGTGEVKQKTGEVRRNTGNVKHSTAEAHRNTNTVHKNKGRKQSSPRKLAAKRRRRRILLLAAAALLAVFAVIFFLYQNSYEGVINNGYRALGAGKYQDAERYFNRAASKNMTKADAYVGLSKVYIQQNNTDSAEYIFLNAIAVQPDNAALYKAAIQFYVDTGQQGKISGLLADCDEEILTEVSSYVSKMPEFSLKEENYTEVQELSLTSNGTIYYTDDGSEPTSASTLYTKPILLNEGTTVIKAISVNGEGIPSLVASRTYTIEIPIADAPAVTPSTGQYYEPTQITVNVPAGYTAYYTIDGSEPAVGSAATYMYSGPVDMPQGQSLFAAILVNNAGKATKATKRNYILQY